MDLIVSWGLPDFLVYIHSFSEGSFCFASRAKVILDETLFASEETSKYHEGHM